jgi:hypothetical protein
MSSQLSENDELAIGPLGGLAAGLVAGTAVTTLVVPQTSLALAWPAPWLPWAVFGVLGLLYGACQLRVPIRGLLAVGVFYGVFLWVLTNLFGWILFPQAAAQLRSWPGICVFVLFSSLLGLTSVVVSTLGSHEKEEARH